MTNHTRLAVALTALLPCVLFQNGCHNPADNPAHFANGSISFDYIKYYTDDALTPSLRQATASNGIELLFCRSSHYNPVSLLVVRRPSNSSFDALYEQKKGARPDAFPGLPGGNQHIAKYAVSKIEANGRPFVRAYGGIDNGDQAVSYQLMNNGYEYNINFIYPKGRFGGSELAANNDLDGEHALMTLRSLQF